MPFPIERMRILGQIRESGKTAVAVDTHFTDGSVILPREIHATADDRLRLRDQAVFEDLVRSHRREVSLLARRLLAWPHEVEEVVQEVFVRAWEKAPGFRGASAPSTWLAGITINVCRSTQRRLWRRKSQPLEDALDVASGTETAEASESTALRVRAAIARLSPKLREVVVLRYLEDRAIEEITTIVRASRRAVDTRLSRARRELARLLECDEGHLS